MAGRYGNDHLNFTILALALLCSLASFFVRGVGDLVLALVQFVLLAFWAMRAFSRNRFKRSAENNAFLRFFGKFKEWFKPISAFFSRIADRQHKYFKCPNCKSRLRVPRGRGSITVTCPRCRQKFDKKS